MEKSRQSCRLGSLPTWRCLFDALVVRVGEGFLDRGGFREVQVDALGRNRAGEPLGVDLVDLARLHHAIDGLVDQRLELRIILAQHHAVRLLSQRTGQDFVGRRILGVGDLPRQQNVVHHERGSPAIGHQQEALGVILAVDFLEFHVLGLFVLFQQRHGGRARGGDDGLARQLRKIVDARIFFHRSRHVDDEVGRPESHLFLARHRVGRGAALQVDGAVFKQGNAVARRDRGVVHFQTGHFQIGLDGIDHLAAQLHRVADGFAVVVEVGEGNRRLAVTDGDAVGFLHFFQRAGELGCLSARYCGRSQDGQTKQFFDHANLRECRNGVNESHKCNRRSQMRNRCMQTPFQHQAIAADASG